MELLGTPGAELLPALTMLSPLVKRSIPPNLHAPTRSRRQRQHTLDVNTSSTSTHPRRQHTLDASDKHTRDVRAVSDVRIASCKTLAKVSEHTARSGE
eukprot:3419772-Rhodomonas_salina.1